MFRTKEEIRIPKGTEVTKADKLGWFTEPKSGVYIYATEVEIVDKPVEATEPGHRPISELELCYVCLILSQVGNVKKYFIGMKNTDGVVVLRDSAGTIPNPLGWKEL